MPQWITFIKHLAAVAFKDLVRTRTPDGNWAIDTRYIERIVERLR